MLAVQRGRPVGGWLTALFVVAPLAGLLHWLESWLAHDVAYRLLADMRLRFFRALDALALLEWDTGDRTAAIARGWELLRLNPNDNQGVRYSQMVRLLTAGSCEQIDRLLAAYSDEVTEREVEPIGLYYGQHWHLVAYCRLREAFRDFRLDRITQLHLPGTAFAPRPETLQLYWQQLRERRPQHVAVVRFATPAAARVRCTALRCGCGGVCWDARS